MSLQERDTCQPKEKRRRLILESSDSELDDYYISPRIKNSDGDSTSARNQLEILLQKEEKKEIEATRDNKERYSDSGSVRKRNGESIFEEKPAKKSKIEFVKEEKKPRLAVPECRYERDEIQSGSFLSTKKIILDNRDRNGFKENGKIPSLKRLSNTSRDEIRRRVADHVKHEKSSSLEKVNNGISSSINGLRNGFFPNNEKLYALNKKFHNYTEDKENSKVVLLKKPSLVGERSSTEGSSSSIKLQKCQEHMDKMYTRKTKDLTKSNSEPERNEPSSTSPTAKVNRGSRGRNVIKQKVRDQIKKMLFDAGWTIELRPRRNRDYEDSVYVSPEGTGYWSITKAYSAFQEKEKSFNNNNNNNDKSIAKDELDMLKRTVRNKRRCKEDLVEIESKHRVLPRKDHSISSITKRQRCSLSFYRTNREREYEECEEEIDDYTPYEWKRTVLSWLIDQGVVRENSKVKYMNMRKARARLEGRIRREGILCYCCSKTLTVSKFELHAGSKEKKPYENIYIEELGISLLQCLLDAWKKQEVGERKDFYKIEIGDDPSDDTCGICGDGGDLICCDSCPSTFHLSCLCIQKLPPGDWHCINCSCKFCGSPSSLSSDKKENSMPAYSPLLSCLQCRQKYHEDCVSKTDSISINSGSGHDMRNLFCGQICKKIYRQMQRLLGVKNEMESGFSWTLIRRLDEKSPKYLQRLSQVAHCNSKIAVALAVMDECFLPIIDERTGINLIHNVVYNCGSNFSRLNYSGFYTFILERGDEIISAASVRVHGNKLAEMPFIGTRNMYRRQGMCRRLLNGIESALRSLNVERLIIPAISELKDTWTNVFGFNALESSQRREINSLNMIIFPDTGLLQKPLLKENSFKAHNQANGGL